MNNRDKWFLALAKLCCPADPEKASVSFRAFMPILTEFPDEAFCQQSLTHCARAFRFLPSYGEFVASFGGWWMVNRPTSSDERAQEWPALPSPEPSPELSEEELSHIRAVAADAVKALHAQAKEREAGETKDKPMPRHLSDSDLLAEYVAMGDAGAIRAAMIRRKLGIAA